MYTIGGTLMHADKDGNMLMHSAKGTEWKNHKYVDKVRKGGKWVYSYASKKLLGAANAITGKEYKREAMAAALNKNEKAKKAAEDAYKNKSVAGKVESIVDKLQDKWNSKVEEGEEKRTAKQYNKVNTGTTVTSDGQVIVYNKDKADKRKQSDAYTTDSHVMTDDEKLEAAFNRALEENRKKKKK